MVKKLQTLQIPIRIEFLAILLCNFDHKTCIHRNLLKKIPAESGRESCKFNKPISQTIYKLLVLAFLETENVLNLLIIEVIIKAIQYLSRDT